MASRDGHPPHFVGGGRRAFSHHHVILLFARRWMPPGLPTFRRGFLARTVRFLAWRDRTGRAAPKPVNSEPSPIKSPIRFFIMAHSRTSSVDVTIAAAVLLAGIRTHSCRQFARACAAHPYQPSSSTQASSADSTARLRSTARRASLKINSNPRWLFASLR